VPAHELPSARGQGEPLTGRLSPPPGATFVTVVAGADQDWLLLSTTGGYGFLAMMKELQTKNRTGKSLLSVPHNSEVMVPCRIMDPETDWVAVVTLQGRLLAFLGRHRDTRTE